jgi:hypothetical protein
MAIKEQKLFFTRHDEYSEWEMLEHLPQPLLEKLYKFALEKHWAQSHPRSTDDYPAFLFRLYTELPEEERELFYKKIKDEFNSIEKPLSDFNGLLYHYSGTSFDVSSACANLEELRKNINTLGIPDLEMMFFTGGNILDVRFTTKKLSSYKKSDIDQMIHTEIRVYLDKNLALMTNFTDYTHKDSEKQIFIQKVIERVSSYRGKIVPVELSDSLLRKLLATTGTIPTKFTFDIEDRMLVGFKFKDVLELEEMIRHDKFKSFFDSGLLQYVKIKISPNDNKFLQIEGPEGKILSRTKNLEAQDIDSFIINLLSPLIKFDYLNKDYKHTLRQMAIAKLGGLKNQKSIIANRIYKDILDTVYTVIKDETQVKTHLIVNTFIFCLKNEIFFLDREPLKEYQLKPETVGYLSKIVEKDAKVILNLFSNLLSIYMENSSELNTLFETLDHHINTSRRMITNASGI